jgi:hypothetical protein
VNTKTPEETDRIAEKMFSEDDLLDLHYRLILF